jgi:excisionase family DNA binding protein
MTNNGFPRSVLPQRHGPAGPGETRRTLEIVRHLSIALHGLTRRLHHEGFPMPREVEELSAFLVGLVRARQDPSAPAQVLGAIHDTGVPDRLLVTKGEAAKRLGVSVRTIERLVATGRLRQVHVERLARFRVSDLEEYVDGLAGDAGPDPGTHDDHRRWGAGAPPRRRA